jgi:hypothetical protein
VMAATFASTEVFGFFRATKTSEALESIFHIFIHGEKDHAETFIEGKRSRNAVFLGATSTADTCRKEVDRLAVGRNRRAS